MLLLFRIMLLLFRILLLFFCILLLFFYMLLLFFGMLLLFSACCCYFSAYCCYFLHVAAIFLHKAYIFHVALYFPCYNLEDFDIVIFLQTGGEALEDFYGHRQKFHITHALIFINILCKQFKYPMPFLSIYCASRSYIPCPF